MKICLLTTGQPSTNPRVVKEADALVEAGYRVWVLGAHWATWADETDERLLRSRPWSYRHVDGQTAVDPRVRWSRLRYAISRRLSRVPGTARVVHRWAICRVLPELERDARATPADLYIAHYPGALPAAVAAARAHGARVGFDAEDFHAGSRPAGNDRRVGIVEYVERRYLPQCDYVTASSPDIAEAYTRTYMLPRSAVVLNVFPLRHRPAEFPRRPASQPVRLYWFSQTIGAHRGLEDIVRAMGALRDRRVELHLRGEWQAGYRERLLALAAASGTDSTRLVAHPPAPPDDMVRLAAGYDIGLALEPGRDENNRIALSNKLFVCLLAGNALLVTETTAQRRIAERVGAAAFSYRPGDVEALARGLRCWVDDPDLLERARHAAWEWGAREYNWELERHKLLRVVEAALAGPSARRESRAGAAAVWG